MIGVTFKGLKEAAEYFENIGKKLTTTIFDGMDEAADSIEQSILAVVPHKGYHLDKSGADYHIFRKEPNFDLKQVICGPTAPYVPILEYGSAAVMSEYEPTYKLTKLGNLLSGLRFVYQGIPDVFFLRPGADYPPKHYLVRSLEHAWERVKTIIGEAARRAVRD